MFTPPLPRQPSCRLCGHEEHVYTTCELTRSAATEDDQPPPPCPCPPHQPTGIYEETR